MVNVVSHDNFSKVPTEGCERGRWEEREGWGKIKWKLSGVNTRAVSRGHVVSYSFFWYCIFKFSIGLQEIVLCPKYISREP